MGPLLLVVVVAMPFVMAVVAALVAERRPHRTIQASSYASLALAIIVTLAVVDVTIVMPLGRALTLSPLAQLGIQLLALSMLGLGMSLTGDDREAAGRWLPLAWLSLGGLVLSLLVTSLTLATLTFVAAALVWALGPPKAVRASTTGPGLRYAALLALALAPLLAALRLAEMRAAMPEIEPLVRALLVPGFGLLLSVVPLHAWTVTLASGSPRAMVIGVLALVQTAGLVLLVRVLSAYPWLMAGERTVLLVGGALSLLVGGWMALSSESDDPDDWLAYATIANTGLLIMGLGTQSIRAATGITLMLFARVLALVTIALAVRAPYRTARVARAAGTLTLAGTPGMAGFPSVWLILAALQLQAPSAMSLAVLAGSLMLFATALRRWWMHEPEEPVGIKASDRPWWPIVLLVALLLVLGFAPQLVAGAFGNALSGPFLINQ